MVQWSLDGKLYSMTLVANKVVREYPTHARGGTQAHMVSSINLLDPAVHDARAQLRLGAYLFAPSRPGLELTTKTAKLALPAKLSVAVHFRLVPGTGGYLFAKTSQHGDVKHLAVYVSKSQRDVAVYCQIGGVPTRTRFKINLTDGKKYRLLVTIDQGSLKLLVDNVMIGGVRSLGKNALTDCDHRASDCTAFIGQRDATNVKDQYRMNGVVFETLIVPGHVLDAYPLMEA